MYLCAVNASDLPGSERGSTNSSHDWLRDAQVIDAAEARGLRADAELNLRWLHYDGPGLAQGAARVVETKMISRRVSRGRVTGITARPRTCAS